MSERKNQGLFEIKEALRLDTCGQEKEAFNKYLEGVQNLSGYIKNETNLMELSENSRANALKVIQTMKQSLNRIEEIVTQSTCKSSAKVADGHLPTLEISAPTSLVASQQHTETNRFQDNRRLSSYGKALKENARLCRIFQNRSSNIKNDSQRVTMGLELQRRMIENITVAKSQEAQLKAEQAKKDSEALQLAARKLAMNSAPNETCSNSHQSWSNKVALCACVMHYKYKENWIQEINQQFRLKPSQFLINTAIERILDTSDHPLTNWFTGKQENLKGRISNMLTQYLAYESRMTLFLASHNANTNGTDVVTLFDPLRNLTGDSLVPRGSMEVISNEICSILETFLQVFSVSLDLTEANDYVDACYITVEREFFKDLWPATSQLYRLLYKDEEVVFTSACQRLQHVDEANVSELDNVPSPKLDPIIRDLHCLSALCSPLAKLHSLVDITHSLCDEDNSEKNDKILSADDLIGLVSCLLVQSNLPQLLSELEAIEQLVPHRFLLGEEGYSLTTFQTAIKYLESQGKT